VFNERDLPRLLESGSLEDRKEFVRAFVGGVRVVPDDALLEVQMRTLPAVASSCLQIPSVGW
jgi:hypothetical protein